MHSLPNEGKEKEKKEEEEEEEKKKKKWLVYDGNEVK